MSLALPLIWSSFMSDLLKMKLLGCQVPLANRSGMTAS
jgi:hypothetical protein